MSITADPLVGPLLVGVFYLIKASLEIKDTKINYDCLEHLLHVAFNALTIRQSFFYKMNSIYLFCSIFLCDIKGNRNTSPSIIKQQ